MNNEEHTHCAIEGIIRDATTRPNGVLEINDFEIHAISLVPAEQALHPAWRVLEDKEGRNDEQHQRRTND